MITKPPRRGKLAAATRETMSGDDELTIAQPDSVVVTASEISWRLAPIARLEDLPADALVDLTHDELLEHVAHEREDHRAVRKLLQQSLGLNATQRDELTRATRIIERLQHENRALRQELAALRKAA